MSSSRSKPTTSKNFFFGYLTIQNIPVCVSGGGGGVHVHLSVYAHLWRPTVTMSMAPLGLATLFFETGTLIHLELAN